MYKKSMFIFANIIGLAVLIFNPSQIFSQENTTKSKATDLPNISVIGQFLGSSNSEQSSFKVKEIEISLQHNIYPGVRADVFTTFHKEGNKSTFELEEAYLTFSDVFDTFTPDYHAPFKLGAYMGKKLLNVGKMNSKHSEQWYFVDKAKVLKQFFGEDHGLAGEGVQLNYLLPTPFFSQASVGYYSYSDLHEEDSTGATTAHSDESITFYDSLLNARLWNSFSLDTKQELELGFSYLLGNAADKTVQNQQEILGFDLSYNLDLSYDKKLIVLSETYIANYGEENETTTEIEGDYNTRARQDGQFVSAIYQQNKYNQAGLRFGTLGKHGDEGKRKNQWSFLYSKKLTETSKLKFQYNAPQNEKPEFLFKFIFGFGPHSHVLQ